jgi:hypothetical protein
MLLLDPARLAALGAAGRQAVAAHFTAEQMAQRVESVFEQTLRQARIERGPGGT